VWYCDYFLKKKGWDITPESIAELYHKKNDYWHGSEARGPMYGYDDLHIHWRRTLMLIIAVTMHNFPEGLAVGVAFGGISPDGVGGPTFSSAWSLAIGVGIQNFPEGLAVSLPLRRAGLSKSKSFWYGQLSGMVEPTAGLLGACLVHFIRPLIPYALAFAAGAMVYVVVNDLIPEARSNDNGILASWGTIIGFIIMMILEISYN